MSLSNRLWGLIVIGWSTTALAQGDGTFQAPYSITNAGRPGPATVHAGDFNGDGKVDLVTANGSSSILIYFQNAVDRLQWKQLRLPVGSQVWFVRAADFTTDSFEDIVATDITGNAWFLRSLGNGAFVPPVEVRDPNEAVLGARWTAIGDWNVDGDLDFATANISRGDLTIFLGNGAGEFTFHQKLIGSREHTLEALDYDGDGVLDLFLGAGLTGLTPYRGLGNGNFAAKDAFEHMGCVEYLAEVGHWKGANYILWGDLDGDKRGDLAPTCVETESVSVGVSLGDGTYREVLETPAGPGVDSTALADLNGDGKTDLAIASKGSTTLFVHLGKGDGTFLPEPAQFGPTGNVPRFLITRDLDADGHIDVISGDDLSSTITLFWGRSGERFLESAVPLANHLTSRAMAEADLDGDSWPDLFFANADQPQVQVYLAPGRSFPATVGPTIPVQGRYSVLEAADLDGDGVPDLAGADLAGGKALVTLLDKAGAVRDQQAMDAGLVPSAVEVGQLDGAAPPDLAVLCQGSNHVAVCLGQGGGRFADARILPTIEKPKRGVLADWDADGSTDLAVLSDTRVAVHFGAGNGEFSAPMTVVEDSTKLYTDVAAGDLNGDAKIDLVVAESKTQSVLVYAGRGTREFEAPSTVRTNGGPTAVVLADLNGDRRLDLTASSSGSRSASVLLNQTSQGFPSLLVYGLGVTNLVGHRLADLNRDGAADLVAVGSASAAILYGRPAASPETPRFRRGDVSADGEIAINDPILILSRLFLGGEALPCEKAADADDDGTIQINDPIAILNRMFLGGEILPPPGPEGCGEDPNPDALVCATGCP